MGKMRTPRRDDGRRNREAILRVAEAAFVDDSDMVSLPEIARRVGLARATVYRHFPDRHALGGAVAAQYMDELRRVIGTAESDGRSFRDLLHWVLSTQVSNRPLAILLRELPTRDQQHHVEALVGVLTPPFRRAQAAGQLRPDLIPADLAIVMAMLDGAAGETAIFTADREAALHRLVAVLLDGLFAPGA